MRMLRIRLKDVDLSNFSYVPTALVYEKSDAHYEIKIYFKSKLTGVSEHSSPFMVDVNPEEVREKLEERFKEIALILRSFDTFDK